MELLNAIAQLSHEKCKGLIIDLRDNTGGYMEAATRMVNEFLPEGKLIVYTHGRKYPRMEEYANGTGSCQKLPLVVLVNESSASASEIFAGAIQDNDRGTIVGRRSFGKGLVQQPIDFSDGSAIRLTIARYYTPSGRCIQRPYENGKDSKYEMDWITRYEHGEFFSKDSIKLDENLRYSTGLGRPVYGGGGIMPDKDAVISLVSECRRGEELHNRSIFLPDRSKQQGTDSAIQLPVYRPQPREIE